MMMVQGWRDGIPLKRGGTTEDVNACLFLASDMSLHFRTSSKCVAEC
jgi:3-oxoacyl-[acyl-carrier protein] reductase